MADEVNNAHPVDEDPEDHIGDELPDPWDQPNPWADWTEEQLKKESK